jgi:uncharacterized FlaG/YvyC family protein
MDITAISRNVEMLHAPAPAIPADKAAENREVVQAVRAVNGAELFGQDSELMFQKDPITQRMVVQLVNPKTKEVISQIPAEYVLRLAEDLKPRKT